MKAIVGRGAIVASTLFLGLVASTAETSIADTLFLRFQSPQPETNKPVDTTLHEAATVISKSLSSATPLGPATQYVATAYSLRGRTASGRMVAKGLIAADPRVLPLGARVRLEAGGYSGEYLVADTGGMIKGRRIDIWIPSSREAMKFGRRKVKLTVLSYPVRRTRKTPRA